MNITSIKHHGGAVLMDRLREVHLMKENEHIQPYKDATIQLINMRPEFLSPPQTYVLQQELEKIRQLRWALTEWNVDLFNLDGYVTIQTDELDEPVDVLPVIVEMQVEADGSPHFIINDGMHRAYIAHTSSIVPQVCLISGATHTYYAYPVGRGFNNVQMVDELPEGFIKKWHRILNYRSLYRNFNSAFVNVGASRGRFEKSEYSSMPTKFESLQKI